MQDGYGRLPVKGGGLGTRRGGERGGRGLLRSKTEFKTCVFRRVFDIVTSFASRNLFRVTLFSMFPNPHTLNDDSDIIKFFRK